MRVTGRENVWAIGDAAAVPDPAKRRQGACPPTAQHALRQGQVVAENVAAHARRAARRGRSATARSACSWTWASTRRWPRCSACALRGFPAWFAARTYHLAMMPGSARRLRLMADWTVGLFFGRASAELGQLGHPPPAREPCRATARGGSRAT